MHFGLFDVAKWGDKFGILRNQDVIFSKKTLKLSTNSKRKGEKGMSER